MVPRCRIQEVFFSVLVGSNTTDPSWMTLQAADADLSCRPGRHMHRRVQRVNLPRLQL
jgi:hypothetical protein